MWKKFSFTILALLVAVLGYAATKPDTFQVRRSAHIKAAPETIFPHINTLAHWAAWSPWEKMDPAMKKTLNDTPSGKGAAIEWDGNNDVGKGRMEITDSTPSSKVSFKLDFIRPFEGHNQAEFTIERAGDSSRVTWAMFGPQAYAMKVMSVFVDCDKMIGKDFEAGLANLKALAEK